MSNIINIQLKEKEAYKAIDNGSYSCNINETVTIENGDQIMIKKAFIDTVTVDSQIIFIPENINAVINYSVYIKNYESTPPIPRVNNPALYVDCSPWILCNERTKSGTFDAIISIEFFRRDGGDYKSITFGNQQPYTLEYIDINDEKQLIHGNFPTKQYPDDEIIIGARVVCKPNTFKNITPPDIMKKANLGSFQEINKQPVEDPVQWIPQNYTTSFLIEAGNYAPAEFASILSTKCQAVPPSPFTGSHNVKSPFLKIATFTNNFVAPNVDFEATYALQPASNAGVYVGASLVSFTFNEYNKFVIDNMHTPYYHQPSGNVPAFPAITSQTVIENGAPQPNKYAWLNSHSGVMLTSLSPPEFWHGTLGFNLSTLCPVLSTVLEPLAGKYLPVYPFADGVNIVTQKLIQDDLVVKNANFAVPPANFNAIFNTTDLTTEIVAENSPFSNEINKNGYYQIRIGNKILNKLITPNDNNNNIQSIISTYYSLNSYTLGTEGDSIIYTHRGDPITLNNFDVDILDANGELAPNLGNDSTIFLQVMKNITEL